MEKEKQMETEDLTGRKFGRLTAIERSKDYISKRGKHLPMWLCRCECGTEKVVYAGNLKQGSVKSCGCIMTEDLTGQKFNMLTVIKQAETKVSKNGNRTIMWECKCDCGNTTIVAGGKLKNGSTKSCGCLSKDKAEDFAGQRFGKLVAIERAEDIIGKSGSRSTAWLCKCDCGNKKVVTARNLKRGKTKSCGCDTCPDLTGQKFGTLTVIKRAGIHENKHGRRSVMWQCRCDCGNEKILSTNRLNDKRLKTCGECTKKSRLGEGFVSRCGLKGAVTKYTDAMHVEVTLEDGTVCETRYNQVKNGGVYPHEMSPKLCAKEYHGHTRLSFAFKLEDSSVYFYCFTPDDEWDVLTLREMYQRDNEVKNDEETNEDGRSNRTEVR